MSLSKVDPDNVYFTFSRIRPQFSCGRRVEDTINAILNKEISAEDLPPISVLVDPSTGDLFSLNNRRLYVFKALKQAGKLRSVPVRVKPVPQTKRMKEKYSAAKCAKVARLMLEREAIEALGSDLDIEGENEEDEDDTDSRKVKGASKSEAANASSSNAVASSLRAETTETDSKAPKKEQNVPESKPEKYVKAARNMDDWTDEEDNGGKKRAKGTRRK